jgi:hypothetical protein
MASTQIYSDGISLVSQPAGTYGQVSLGGGTYGVSFSNFTGAPTLQIQRVLADGTFANVFSAALSTAGYQTVQLPPGLVQLVIAGTAVAADASLTRIKLA